MPKQKVVRDAGTGQFVKPEEAKKRPVDNCYGNCKNPLKRKK